MLFPQYQITRAEMVRKWELILSTPESKLRTHDKYSKIASKFVILTQRIHEYI